MTPDGAAAPTCQFTLHIAAVDGDLGGPEAVEELALELRTELTDAPVTRIDQVPTGTTPEGARGIEIVQAAQFLMTAVQTAAAIPGVIAAIRRTAQRYAQRNRRVRLTVAGVELDPVEATDDDVRQVVDRLLALPAQGPAGVRSALVVANASYDDPRLAQLRAPSHDADALVRVLGDPAIGGFNVDLLMDADERTIRRRVAAFFADRNRDDVLVLHFSCHGVKDARGRLHLAAHDTDLSTLGATAVPAAFVNDLMSETQSRRVVLILDCCYSGAFARGSQVRAGNEVLIADEFGAGSGRIVLTASSATEYAFEGGELASSSAQPSAFTSALVAGLETGEADADADGEITIDELYDHVYRAVRETTPGQAPMKWSFGVEGSLVVARSVRPAALPTWIDDDLLSDRVVLRLEAVRGLERILASGKPGLRATALATLARLRDHDDSVRVQRAAAAVLGAQGVPDGLDATGTGAIRASPAVPTQAVIPAPPAAPTPPAAPGSAEVRSAERDPATGAAAERSPEPRRAAAAPLPPPAEPVAVPAEGGLFGWHTVRGPRRALLIAGGSLTLLGVLLYLIGVATEGSEQNWGWVVHEGWPRGQGVAWAAAAVAAVLLLATGRAGWAGMLAGLLSWEWLYLALIGTSQMPDYFGEWAGVYLTANLIALTALGCAVAAVVLTGRPAHRTPRPRWLAAAGVAALALATTLVAVELMADVLFADEGSTGLYVTAVLCAAVPPVVCLAAPTGPVVRYASLGWLIGGAQYALIGSNALADGFLSDSTTVVWLWVLLVVTAAAVLGTALLTRREGGLRRR